MFEKRFSLMPLNPELMNMTINVFLNLTQINITIYVVWFYGYLIKVYKNYKTKFKKQKYKK